jgi:glycosyl transferase, family 25
MSVNQWVDAVYALSVRTFADRIAHIRAEMARHSITFEFVFDYDPDAIPRALIEQTFAPSDMKITHQSLVLKHMQTWRLAVERNLRRVLVFEDDAVLADDFTVQLERALREADRLAEPYMIYLGRGNNQHVGGGPGGAALVPGGVLPATDAVVFNRAAAVRRLEYLTQHRITRPADWLTRETDAAVGVVHYWLREPIVEQGSMNGKFVSVLDSKRRRRGRWFTWASYRSAAWWRRLRRRMRTRWAAEPPR